MAVPPLAWGKGVPVLRWPGDNVASHIATVKFSCQRACHASCFLKSLTSSNLDVYAQWADLNLFPLLFTHSIFSWSLLPWGGMDGLCKTLYQLCKRVFSLSEKEDIPLWWIVPEVNVQMILGSEENRIQGPVSDRHQSYSRTFQALVTFASKIIPGTGKVHLKTSSYFSRVSILI